MAKPISHGSLPKLTRARIRQLKALAQRVDAREADAIKTRGRAVFRRHATARQMVSALKSRRIEKGLKLADVAARTGIATSNLSRLENNEHVSPTLDTLSRYAQAIGMHLNIELVGRN